MTEAPPPAAGSALSGPRRGAVRRWSYRIAGAAAFAAGAVGVVAPLVPTTAFWLLAVFCFLRSDPRWAQALLRHPRFGPPLRDWFEEGAIGRGGKLGAALALLLGGAWGVWSLRAQPGAGVVVAFVLAMVALFLISRPRPSRLRRRPL